MPWLLSKRISSKVRKIQSNRSEHEQKNLKWNTDGTDWANSYELFYLLSAKISYIRVIRVLFGEGSECLQYN